MLISLTYNDNKKSCISNSNSLRSFVNEPLYFKGHALYFDKEIEIRIKFSTIKSLNTHSMIFFLCIQDDRFRVSARRFEGTTKYRIKVNSNIYIVT